MFPVFDEPGFLPIRERNPLREFAAEDFVLFAEVFDDLSELILAEIEDDQPKRLQKPRHDEIPIL